MNDINLSTLAPIYPEIVTPVVWWPYLLCFLGILLLVMLVVIGMRRRHTRRFTTHMSIQAQLEALDFETEPTEALYRFSLLIQSLPESLRPEELPQLLHKLEPYKYTPAPPPIPEKLLTRIHRMTEEVVV